MGREAIEKVMFSNCAGILTIPLTVALEIVAPKLDPSWGQYITPFMNRTGMVFWACMLTCVLVSLVTKPKSDEELKGLIWNKESLHVPKELQPGMRGLRNPTIWWAIIFAFTVFLYVRFR